MKLISKLFILSLVVFTISCKSDKKAGMSAVKKGNGALARDILSDDTYTKIRLELLYPEGFRPEDESIENLKDFVNSVANKSEGISVVERVIPAFEDEKLTIDQIVAFEDENREFFPSGNTMSIFVLCTNTGYSQDTESGRVLGVAYFSTSMCIFQKNVHDFSGGGTIINPQPSRETLETTVLNHEFGHLIGLVNNGTAMVENHQDPDASHGKHCVEESCLMYFQAETTADLSSLMGGSIPQLDDFCRQDIRNNGGR